MSRIVIICTQICALLNGLAGVIFGTSGAYDKGTYFLAVGAFLLLLTWGASA